MLVYQNPRRIIRKFPSKAVYYSHMKSSMLVDASWTWHRTREISGNYHECPILGSHGSNFTGHSRAPLHEESAYDIANSCLLDEIADLQHRDVTAEWQGKQFPSGQLLLEGMEPFHVKEHSVKRT